MKKPDPSTALTRPGAPEFPPQDDFVSRARQVIALRRSPRTREAYNEDLDRWLEFCASTGADPQNPPGVAITTFRDHLIASFAPASVRRILAALSSTYSGLRKLGGGVQLNPFDPDVLPWPMAPAGGHTPAVAAEDAEAMIALCEEESKQNDDVSIAKNALRDAAILRLLYDTGLRRASVAGLLRVNIRKEGRRVLLRVVVKGGKEEEVSLPEITASALNTWLKVNGDSPYVFPASRGGSHLHPNVLNRILTERGNQAGVEHVHPHAFRASFVTAAYDTGLPEHEIQGSVHHSDPKVTRMYDRRARGLGVAEAVAEQRGKRKK